MSLLTPTTTTNSTPTSMVAVERARVAPLLMRVRTTMPDGRDSRDVSRNRC
jgi:hypothetical protein